MGGRLYDNLWARLMANTKPEFDNEQACWVWVGKGRCRFGYARLMVYVPGLKARVKLTAHILSWVIMQLDDAATVDDIYLAYLEFRCSGLELDHGCTNTPCCRPDHLEPVTRRVNMLLSYERRRLRRGEERC